MTIPAPMFIQQIGTLFLLGLGQKACLFYDSSTNEVGQALLATASEAIAKGQICCALIGGTSNKVSLCPTSGASHSMPIGVALTAASGDGQTFWLAQVGSKVQVLPESGITAAMGNVIVTSTSVAGRASQSSTVPGNDHWDEIGHFAENGSGAGALALAYIHAN